MRLRATIILCVSSGLFVSACGCGDSPADASNSKDNVLQRPGVKTELVTSKDEVFTVEYSGQAEAAQDAALGFVSPGRIDVLRCEVGATVARGEVLARQDQASLSLSVEQAQASLRVMESQAGAAKRELARSLALFESGAITQSVLDKAKDAAELADSQAQQAAVALKLARRRLVDAELRAPFAGVVAEVNGRAGEIYSPSSPRPLLRLVDTSSLKVLVDLPASAALSLVLPTPVTVASSGIEVPGNLVSLHPIADNRTGTMTGEVLVPQPGRLVPGIEVTVRLALTKQGCLTVPDSALVFRDAKVYAFTVENGAVHRRQLRLGLQGGGRSEVESGLESGQAVVTSGAALLVDGQEVSVAESAP